MMEGEQSGLENSHIAESSNCTSSNSIVDVQVSDSNMVTLPVFKSEETGSIAMMTDVPSNDEDLNEDKEMQHGVNHLIESEELKLELPDNLDSEDISKLLEFDDKHDDDLFATQDILETVIPDTGRRENEEIKDEMSQSQITESRSTEKKDKTPEGSLENEQEIIHRHEGEDETGNIPNPLAGNTNTFLIKEETLSPRRTFSDIDNSMISLRDAHTYIEQTNGSSNTHPVLENDTLADKLPSPSQKNDDSTPAAILHEKDSLAYPKRHDSLTPMMFQQHELKQISGADTGHSSGKEASKQESPIVAEEQPTISAYARLDFQSFTFYVQTLHVIIGRRSENDFTHKVDVNLGPSKSISRRHAQIFYNFGTGRFELSIIGKNGAFVDDIFVERGNTVPLKNKTKIQIGQIPFQFALPEQESTEKIQKTPDESKPKEANNATRSLQSIKSENEGKQGFQNQIVKKQPKKQPVKKEKKPAKVPKKVYTLEEIPVEYRTKPTYSYSSLLTTCIRKYSSPKGMSLSEIYAGIRELFPYYKYCPDGWQSSVRHNLSLNKSFRKVSKEGKGWLWGLDEDYITEREQLKKKQAEAAAAKAQAAQQKLEQQQQQQQQRAKKSSIGAAKDRSSTKGSNVKQQNISQTLAANRAADKKSNIDDHQRTMKYLQEQLMILTRDRKGLSKQVIASILTQALAMTINQVTQAARNKGITGNPLTALMDKNPQHLNLILAAAVNAATSKITNGNVKQLVNLPQSNEISKDVKKATTSPNKKQVSAPSSSNPSGMGRQATEPKSSTGSFDPSSLSRFFQPRQPARTPVVPLSKPVIPQKRSFGKEDEETSSSEESSDSDDDKDENGDNSDDNSDDDSDDDESGDNNSNGSDSSSTSSDDENKDDDNGEDNDESDNADEDSSDEGSDESEVNPDTGNNVAEENRIN